MSLSPSHALAVSLGCCPAPNTQLPPPPPPASQLFSIYEMMERILLELPQIDVIISQRVCSDWRQLIQNSLELQRKLFYKPVGAGLVECRRLIRPRRPVAFNVIEDAKEMYNFRWKYFYLANGAKCPKLFVNYVLLEKLPVWYKDNDQDNRHWHGTQSKRYAFHPESLLLNPHFMRDEPRASWQAMFVTQPPCTKISLWFEFFNEATGCSMYNAEGDEDHAFDEIFVENENGVTAWDVVMATWGIGRNGAGVIEGSEHWDEWEDGTNAYPKGMFEKPPPALAKGKKSAKSAQQSNEAAD